MIEDWIFGLVGGLMIGTAASVFLLGAGRVAGISGIVGNALRGSELAESLPFIAGLAGAPALYALAFGAPALTVTHSLPLLAAAGLLVGFGTQMGGGCTSGHGVCGISRLAPRSIAATGVFMGVAAVVVFVTRHLIGGL